MGDSDNTSKGISDDDVPQSLEIPHRRAPGFASHYASGVILSGPSSDGIYHLLFHADSIAVIKETATYSGDLEKLDDGSAKATYTTRFDAGDTEPFREDKA